jgi:hypothetical protein
LDRAASAAAAAAVARPAVIGNAEVAWLNFPDEIEPAAHSTRRELRNRLARLLQTSAQVVIQAKAAQPLVNRNNSCNHLP